MEIDSRKYSQAYTEATITNKSRQSSIKSVTDYPEVLNPFSLLPPIYIGEVDGGQ